MSNRVRANSLIHFNQNANAISDLLVNFLTIFFFQSPTTKFIPRVLAKFHSDYIVGNVSRDVELGMTEEARTRIRVVSTVSRFAAFPR